MSIITGIRNFIAWILGITKYHRSMEKNITGLAMLEAKNVILKIKEQGIFDNIHDVEFKVFSQFGDDGIIQYLINNIPISRNMFIEFGVENYTESNTRFLLMNNNWKGLIIDGDRANIEYVKNDEIYWKYDLTAVNHFITRDNINSIICQNGFNGEVGILSIDIDGNDYWVWEAIDSVNPNIVIVEYNSVFGKERCITVPYDPDFYRTKAHFSNLYWGCSLMSLYLLAERKGYAFIGSNSSGTNVYFVRKDKIGKLRVLRPEEGYVCSNYRESRDEKGNLTYLSGEKRFELIRGLNVYNTKENKQEKL